MQSSSVGERKPYEPPIARTLTREQAVLYLVGHAYIGNQDAKELMEILFPLPTDSSSRVGQTEPMRLIDVVRRESKGEERQKVNCEESSEKRRDPRFKLEAELTVRSKKGLIPGRTLEISEFGMSAILPVELLVGETVELKIKLPLNPATVRAIVRNRNVFRHGFEFAHPLRETVGNTQAWGTARVADGGVLSGKDSKPTKTRR